LWVPSPTSGAYSIAWKNAHGELESGRYSTSFVGASAAVLAALFLTLIGFYLVAGSVRRDRESGIGLILAGTPLTRSAYLFGKWLAHFAYLSVLGSVALATGLAVWLRYGEGPFALWPLVAPYLLLVPVGLAFTAVTAVLFDVTPGLRGRGGQVLYFFFWTFVFLLLPGEFYGGFEQAPSEGSWPLFDPVGLATFVRVLHHSLPNGFGGDLNLGLAIIDEPIARVPWPGIQFGLGMVGARIGSLLWLLPPFALAVWVFDRFDPARGRARSRRKESAEPVVPPQGTPARVVAPAVALAPISTSPSSARAVAAEARLIWLEARLQRWPLAGTALAAALPGSAGQLPAAIFLLLLGVVLSEVAARESLAGTSPLIHSQPAVPRSKLAWKLGASLLVSLLLGLPGELAALLGGAAGGLAWLLGLGFVATLAVATGSLSRGGRLFLGLYTALWYLALNGKGGPFDFSGRFGTESRLGVAASFLAGAMLLMLLAQALEHRRERA
ncbi:MAG TPA: ABC transporter permease subunit, partial [Thermoanaerobaculia bacterium]|nr:ABC transporter permease subunit [Thermoanaerobaculia bacterium]